jgi:hypothetical protein
LRRQVSLFFIIQMASETPAFSIGVSGKLRPPKKKLAAKKPVIVAYDPLKPPTYRFTRYPWLLTNPKDALALVAIVQAVDPNNKDYTTITPILKFLKNELRQQKMLYPSRIRYPGSQQQILAGISQAIQHVRANQRRLMAFRALAHKWLLKRRFKAGNEEDLVTGEIPKKPVTLTIWSERRTYTFEATTIRRDMLERLLQHSYLFPKYLVPRNPYTNCEMSQEQFSSIISQLRATGLSHWAFEGLLKCNYDMEKFKAMFGEPVKRELIAKHFNNVSAETIDIVIDFMDDQHDENDKYFDSSLYRWALENSVRHLKITKWVSLCRRYHEAIVNLRDRQELGKELLEIRAACLTLCSYPLDLEDLRNEQRKKQGLPPIVLAPPTPEPQPEVELEDGFLLQFTTPPVEMDNLIIHFTHLFTYGDEITITGGDETPPTETETP